MTAVMASKGRAPIPVTLIGGFLGAGKTTLLNHVLSQDHGIRAGVLVNDFGAINIDARLIVGVEGETVSLANGCVCCTIRDDLVGACLGLLRRPEPPEHLLVELSGVSDPVPVLNTFLETDLGTLFSLSSTLVVVDAQEFPQLGGEMGGLARHQIGAADIVVVNKVDLVGSEDLAALKRRVHEMAPGSRILEVSHGRVPLELLFETRPGASAERQPTETWREGDHGPLPEFGTWHWTGDRPLSLPRVRAALEDLPEAVYRAKGIIHLEELPGLRYVLQMVGKRYSLRETGHWNDEQPRSEIVLIGSSDAIHADDLQRRFDACVGTGDESQSPVLRLVRRIAPELLSESGPGPRSPEERREAAAKEER